MERLNQIVSRLEHYREIKAKRNNLRSFVARCPAHDDKSPSLSIDLTSKGNILIHCFSGCGALAVLEALNLNWADLYPNDDYFENHGRRKRIHSCISTHELHLEISRSRRKQGFKQTLADKESELAAFLATRRN